MTPWEDVARSIAAATDEAFAIERVQAVGGGDVNRAYRVAGGRRAYFVKLNAPGRRAMFEAEQAGLAEIARSRAVRVPRAWCAGANARASWLVLEHIEFGAGTARGARELGRRIARMHRRTAARFGWDRDNTIGATPQVNTPSQDWIAFWRDRRLGCQLALATQRGHGGRLQQLGERLLDALPALFGSYRPEPSLLHGDLWSGNAGYDAAGAPVVYDPAVYFGDREADVAMTELFGGFPPAFHEGYGEVFPLDAGYAGRRDLYNLYHVLNHLNLFGGGYGAQAERMIERLLSTLK